MTFCRAIATSRWCSRTTLSTRTCPCTTTSPSDFGGSGRPSPTSIAACAKSRPCFASSRSLDRRPADLSGGEQQRVAIARAMIKTPAVFLFDEPLSNLDAKLRNHMRVEIARLHQRLGATTIYVTHDQLEAMTLADRIVLLKDGRIEQVRRARYLNGRGPSSLRHWSGRQRSTSWT